MTTLLDNEAAARASIAEHEAAVAAASASVDTLREQLALGEATRGDVLRAQRALAKAIDGRENAVAMARVTERRTAQTEQELAAARRTEARVAGEARRAARSRLLQGYLRFLGETAGEALDWNDRIKAWNGDGGSGSLPVPSDVMRAYGRFSDGLAWLQRMYRQLDPEAARAAERDSKGDAP